MSKYRDSWKIINKPSVIQSRIKFLEDRLTYLDFEINELISQKRIIEAKITEYKRDKSHLFSKLDELKQRGRV